MRKIWKSAIACGLCVTMLGGCSGGNAQKETEKQQASQKATVSQKAAVEMVKKVKEKYAADETVDYADPMYNLEKNHVFTFENLPQKYFEQDEQDCFAVYYDSNLTKSVNVTIEEDYENKSVTIKPNLTFCIDGENGGSLANDGTWGSRSKFWLVRNVDLTTGEMLEKPIITVFTTREEMNTPTVQQSVGEDGWYKLTWSEVEGADYYEVYKYWDAGDGGAFSEVTTEGTTVSYKEFKTEAEHEQNYIEKYKDTEIDVTKKYTMNSMLQKDDIFFVVAKTKDGKHSGLSNFCEVKDIANQIPYDVSWDFQTEYEGDHATVLPAYVDMEMKDGSIGEFLIEYHGANVTLLSDGRISLQCKIKNLPIEMRYMYFKGMDYDAFLKDAENVTKREDELATKSVTAEKNIDVPYLPDNDYQSPASEETTDNTPTERPGAQGEEVTAEPGTQGQEPTAAPGTEGEEPQTGEGNQTEEPETEVEDPAEESNQEEGNEEGSEQEAEAEEQDTDNSQNYGELNISEELEKSVYATSAMSEWIAINMLDHQEQIYLGDFPESSDSEKVFDAIWEANAQNPLIGVLDEVSYDYETNGLEVTYQMSKEDVDKMQEASLSKAKEIVKEIIKDGMSDYEKEEAINEYLCSNGSYNEDIIQYINDDGTLDEEASENYIHSFTPYGILVENVGVCESYSEAFLLLAKEAGLEAVIATGTLDGVAHEWNRIKLDGQWYSMDVTNNDSDILPNIYFNLPDELAATMLKQDKEAFIDENVSNYVSNDMNNEYYTKHEMATEDSSVAIEKLSEKLRSESSAQFRLTGDLGEGDIEEIAQAVCDTAQISSAGYYYCAGVLSIVKE